ncbi:MAG: fibronectin type III domain-containing protein [Rikenellaceae bacterium]|nr:fibronectin type III domain-containing protein [Rikenellaceae bacterium]
MKFNRKLIAAFACLSVVFGACTDTPDVDCGVKANLTAPGSVTWDAGASSKTALALTWDASSAIAAGASSFTAQVVRPNMDTMEEGELHDFITPDQYSSSSVVLLATSNYLGSPNIDANETACDQILFDGLATGKQYMLRVRANYPGSNYSEWVWVTDDAGELAHIKVGKGIVAPTELDDKTPPTVKISYKSASEAIVTWSGSDWKNHSADFANAYKIILKKGNDLVVSWNIPANSDIWTSDSYNGCSFLLTALEPETEYNVLVQNVTEGTEPVAPTTFKTEASKVVTMPSAPANPGDVILYEDFSDLFITADLSRGASNYSYDNRNLMDARWIAQGEDPVANDVEGRGCYLVDPSVEVGMFNTIKKYIAITRLSQWGMMSEDNTNGAVCARAGHVKMGASSKCAWLVAPEITCLQQTATVELSFDAAIYDAYPEDASKGLDPGVIIVEVLNGCTQADNASNSYVTASDRIAVTTINLTDAWTRYTVSIDNINNGARLAVGGHRNGVSGQHRFYIDNIEIKVVSYGDLKLQAPKNVVITPTDTTAKVTWDKVNSAEQYVVEYTNICDACGQPIWTALPATAETEATIEGLSFETEYSVRIKAIAGEVESVFCEPVPFKTLAEIKKIATPEVAAVPGFGWVWINVTNVLKAEGYEVYKNGTKVDAVLVSSSDTNTVYRVDANLGLDADFAFEVKGVAAGYEPSEPVAVSGKTAKIWQNTDNVGPTTLSIGWTDLIPGGAGEARAYAVQVATDAAMSNLVYDVLCRDGQANKVTSYAASSWYGKKGGSNLSTPTGITVGQLQPETTYYFRVKTVALGSETSNGVKMNFPMGASDWSPVFSCKTEAKHVAGAKEVIFQGFDDITMQVDVINYAPGLTPLKAADVANPYPYVTAEHWYVYPATTSHLLATFGYAAKAPFIDGAEKHTEEIANYVATEKAGSFAGWHLSDSVSPHQGYVKMGAGSETYNYISTPALNSPLLAAEGTPCIVSFKACAVVTDLPTATIEHGSAGVYTEVATFELPRACSEYTDESNYVYDGKWATYSAELTLKPGDNVAIRCRNKRFVIDDIQIVVK